MKHIYTTMVMLSLLFANTQGIAADTRIKTPGKQQIRTHLAQRAMTHQTMHAARPIHKGLRAAEGITITATNLEVEDWNDWGWGEIDIYASNSQYDLGIFVETETAIGTFSEEVYTDYCYIAKVGTTDTIFVTSATVTVAQATDGVHYTVGGQLTGDDGNTYTLDLSYVLPEKTRDASLTITNAEAEDFRSYDGSIQILGFTPDGKKYLSVCYYADDIAGTFTAADMDTYYTYVIEINGTDTVYYDFVDGDCTATFDGTTLTCTGKFLLQCEDDPTDIPEYTYSISGTFTEEGDDDDDDEGENHIVNGGFEEWTSESVAPGWEGWQITEKGNTASATISRTTDAHSGDYACYVAGATGNKRVSTGKMTLAAGTYKVSFYAKAGNTSGTVKYGYATQQASGDALYNYIRENNTDCQASLTSEWQKVSFSFDLTTTTDLAIFITNCKNAGDCILDDVTMTAGGSDDGDDDETLEYDEDSDFTASFAITDCTLDTEYLEDYGVVYIDAESSNGYMLGLEFNVDDLDGGLIPAGTYPINSTYASGTVSASDGVDEEGYITYSFAGIGDDESIENIWFLVSGTVTVAAENGTNILTVNAKNSLGHTVLVTVGEGSTPVGGTIYSIDFTKGKGDWTIDDKTLGDGLSYVWKQDSNYGMKGSAYVNKTNTASESWLVSPLIDPKSDNATLTVTIEHALNFCTNHEEYMGVYFAPAENPTLWREVNLDQWPAGTGWDFVTSTATVEGVGKGYFAFQYTSDTDVCGTWEVKTFTVNADATGVKSIENVESVEKCYNLAGQRVNANFRGIVICGGKKILR